MSNGYWYYRIRDQEFGPLTFADLKALLDSGRLSPSAEVYGERVPEWTPAWHVEEFGLPPQGERPLLPGEPGYADDVEPAEEPPGPSNVRAADPSVPQVRPWVRLVAKLVDLGWWCFPAMWLLSPLAQLAGPARSYAVGVLVVLSWSFVEAYFLSTMGTTPGKLLMNVKVLSADGGLPRYASALHRGITIWWRGLGLGIPLLAMFTGTIVFVGLLRDGSTPWDRGGAFIVQHGAVGGRRVLVTFGVFLLYVLLAMVLLAPPPPV